MTRILSQYSQLPGHYPIMSKSLHGLQGKKLIQAPGHARLVVQRPWFRHHPYLAPRKADLHLPNYPLPTRGSSGATREMSLETGDARPVRASGSDSGAVLNCATGTDVGTILGNVDDQHLFCVIPESCVDIKSQDRAHVIVTIRHANVSFKIRYALDRRKEPQAQFEMQVRQSADRFLCLPGMTFERMTDIEHPSVVIISGTHKLYGFHVLVDTQSLEVVFLLPKTSSELVGIFRDVLTEIAPVTLFKQAMSPLMTTCLGPFFVSHGDEFVFDARASLAVTDGYAELDSSTKIAIYRRSDGLRLLFMTDLLELSSLQVGPMPDSPKLGKAFNLDGQQLTFLPCDLLGRWQIAAKLADQGRELGLIGDGKAKGMPGFPARFVASAIDNDQFHTVSFSPTATSNGTKSFISADGSLMLEVAQGAPGSQPIQMLLKRIQGDVCGIVGNLIYSSTQLGSSVYTGYGSLFGARALCLPNGGISIFLPKKLPIVHCQTLNVYVPAIGEISSVLDLANITGLQRPALYIETRPQTSADRFDIILNQLPSTDRLALLQSLGIKGFTVLLNAAPNDHSVPNEPSVIESVVVKFTSGQQLPMLHRAERVTEHQHSAMLVIATVRVGKYQLLIMLNRWFSALGVYQFIPQISLRVEELASYEADFAHIDLAPKLENQLNAQIEAQWPKPNNTFVWQSPNLANWKDFVVFSRRDGSNIPGFTLSLRLGSHGQNKLALTEGQQIFLRLESQEYHDELIYTWRSGRLEPFKDQAPAGLIRLHKEDGALMLHIEQGLIYEALLAATRVMPQPQAVLAMSDDGKRISSLSVKGWDGDPDFLEQLVLAGLPTTALPRTQPTLAEWQIRCYLPAGVTDVADFLREILGQALAIVIRVASSRVFHLNYERPELVQSHTKKVKKVKKAKSQPPRVLAVPPVSTIREIIEVSSQALPEATIQPVVSVPVLKKNTPPTTRVRSTEPFLPDLIITGALSDVLEVSSLDITQNKKSRDVIVEPHNESETVLLIEFVDGTYWQVSLRESPEGMSYSRIDDSWPDERRQLEIEQQERQLRSSRQLQFFRNDLSQAVVSIIDGLGNVVGNEFVVDRVMGRNFLILSAPQRALLCNFGFDARGTHVEVISQQPVVLLSLDSVAPHLIPLREGSILPSGNLHELYTLPDPIREPPPAARNLPDEIISVLQSSPIFVPQHEAVLRLLFAINKPQSHTIQFINEKGDTLIVPLVRKSGAWRWGDSAVMLRRAGEKNARVVDGARDKIGDEISLRFYADDTNLLWDIRVSQVFGVPYIYSAHHVDAAGSLNAPVLDRLMAAAAQARSYSAATEVWSYIEPAKESYDPEALVYRGEITLLNQEGQKLAITYQRNEEGLIAEREGVLSAVLYTDGSGVAHDLQLFVDSRTQKVYALRGDSRNPTAVYEVDIILGRGIRLIAVSKIDWVKLRIRYNDNEFLSYLRLIATEIGVERRKTNPKAEPKPEVVQWSRKIPELAATEKLPLIINVGQGSLDATSEPGLDMVQALQGEIFLVAGQDLEAMVFGKPPLGTTRSFNFIGNRGNILQLEMVYSRYQGTQEAKGWLLHPAVHARNESLGVSVNGTRLRHVDYDREGSAQVIRFGSAWHQVTLRYFSEDDTCFGFREGASSTIPEGLANYTKAKRRLRKLLEKSRVMQGCFEVVPTDKGSGERSLRGWKLHRGKGNNQTTIELAYQLGHNKNGEPRAGLENLESLVMTINGQPTEFKAFRIVGQNSLYLREDVAHEISQREPQRYFLGLASDGSPRLREIHVGEFDLTEIYLDSDVWPNDFVPVFRYALSRYHQTVLERATIREWRARLFADEKPYVTNAGLMRFARDYFNGRIVSALRAARLISRGHEEYASLAWNPTSVAVYRQNQEFFAQTIRLSDGRVVSRDSVIFAAELENDVLFTDYAGWKIERILRTIAKPHEAITRTELGNAVLLKAHHEQAMHIVYEKLSALQAQQSNLHGHVQMDAPVGSGDERLRGEVIADEADLDSELSAADLRRRAMQRLDREQKRVLELFYDGATLWDVARLMRMSVQDIENIYDEAMAALLEIAARL